jgi:hypothetical protein
MSNQFLKSTYQFLLHAYPRETRAKRGQVEIDTLLGVSKPNQCLPRIAEARAIVREGIHERIRSTAGHTPLEVLAHGGTFGVLFTLSFQLYWFGMMTYKMTYVPKAHWGQLAPFIGWQIVVAAIALWWSLRPTRLALILWQLSNILGILWFIDYVGRYVTEKSTALSNTVIVLGTIVSLLMLSGTVALWCWSEMPKQSRRPLGWKVALPSIVIPIWASLLGRLESHGNTVLLIAVIAVLLLALVDPRPLIGLGIAAITPLVGGSIAVASTSANSLQIRLLLPAVATVAIALVALRSRSLIRRLNFRRH